MVNTRSGAGGKVVSNRRKQRIAATPYDRTPPSLLPKSPSWFSGIVVPSARAIASGAGKIISAIFSESSSSSSEDEDFASGAPSSTFTFHVIVVFMFLLAPLFRIVVHLCNCSCRSCRIGRSGNRCRMSSKNCMILYSLS